MALHQHYRKFTRKSILWFNKGGKGRQPVYYKERAGGTVTSVKKEWMEGVCVYGLQYLFCNAVAVSKKTWFFF